MPIPEPATTLGACRYYGPELPTLTPLRIGDSPCDERSRPIVSSIVRPGADGSQWDPAFSLALEAKHKIWPLAGATLRSVACRIDQSAPTGNLYVLLWNMIDVPADGTDVGPDTSLMAPVKIQHVLGTDDNFTLDFDEGGIKGDVGLTICLSTTEFTQTLGGAFLVISAGFAEPPP